MLRRRMNLNKGCGPSFAPVRPAEGRCSFVPLKVFRFRTSSSDVVDSLVRGAALGYPEWSLRLLEAVHDAADTSSARQSVG
jgi:hypothetical protein